MIDLPLAIPILEEFSLVNASEGRFELDFCQHCDFLRYLVMSIVVRPGFTLASCELTCSSWCPENNCRLIIMEWVKQLHQFK